MKRQKIVDEICNELRKYNIESVAAQAGVSPKTIYLWLNGQTCAPKISTLVKVSKVIGFEICFERMIAFTYNY